jgi:hypothetical protein
MIGLRSLQKHGICLCQETATHMIPSGYHGKEKNTPKKQAPLQCAMPLGQCISEIMGPQPLALVAVIGGVPQHSGFTLHFFILSI